MATSRDADEIIEKLSSDRARTRDEGVKLLGTWLQGDRAFSFCRLLARNTTNLKPAHLPACLSVSPIYYCYSYVQYSSIS